MGEWIAIQDALNRGSQSELKQRALSINRCCMAPIIVLTNKQKLGLTAGFCRDRMCPTCQERRSRATAAKVTSLTVMMDSPRFLTLTLKHYDRELYLTMAELTTAFRTMRKTKEWQQHVRGGVYAIEVTRNRETDCWHAHIHIIYEGEYWAQKSISDTWKRASEGSYVCDVRAVHSRTSAARYIAKYVAKPTGMSEWPDWAIREFAADMKGRRLIHTFGDSYSVKVDDEAPDEAKIAAEPLISVGRLQQQAARGDAYALRACDLLGRYGGLVSQAMGYTHLWPAAGRPPLETDEVAELIDAIRRVAMWTGDGEIVRETDAQREARIAGTPVQTVIVWVANDSNPPWA